MNTPSAAVPHWGVDLPRGNRPGVPAEQDPPRPMGNALGGVPLAQVTEAQPLVGASRPKTPVYALTVPPRGLSGALRRVAYGIPGYKARRWMLLMAADRIDVLEHNPLRTATLIGGAVALVGLGLWLRRR